MKMPLLPRGPPTRVQAMCGQRRSGSCRNDRASPMAWPMTCAASDLRPLPQQVVIDRGQLDHRRMVRVVARQLDDGGVEVEQKAALRVAAHHALNPEE